jgi:hypothetical protein
MTIRYSYKMRRIRIECVFGETKDSIAVRYDSILIGFLSAIMLSADSIF